MSNIIFISGNARSGTTVLGHTYLRGLMFFAGKFLQIENFISQKNY